MIMEVLILRLNHFLLFRKTCLTFYTFIFLAKGYFNNKNYLLCLMLHKCIFLSSIFNHFLILNSLLFWFPRAGDGPITAVYFSLA